MSEYNQNLDGSGRGTSTDRIGSAADDEQSKTEQIQDQAAEYAGMAKDKAGEYGDMAHERLEQGRTQAASGGQTAARTIRERTSGSSGVAAEAGTRVAEGMESAATYLRQHDTNEMMEDFEVYAKKHPTQTLVGAVVAGFLLGRLLR